MNIWLITVGEPLPVDKGNPRLWRTGILAQVLLARGHQVVWWTSTFDHVSKRQRAEKDHDLDLSDGFRIKLLHGTGYSRTVSFQRLVDHIMLARKFRRLAESELLPDIILCSMPTIELSAAAVAYGTRRGIPVVLDIRDLWPDIFLDIIPGSLHAAARLALRPYYSAVRRACRNASAIVASTPEYVEWGVSLAGRKASHRDKHFFHGYSDNAPEPEAARKAEEFWTTAGVPVDHSLFTVCFFGYFGRQFELETVIRAARSLVKRSNDFRFVLCGDGDRLGDYRRMAADCTNVVFPGFVGRAEIWTLMRRSCVGVAPYASSFPPSMTNKPIEYLSGGLPVVSTLKGTLEALLKDYECGISYRNGDAEGLARIFEELHAESDRLSRMRGNALRLFQEKFVADNVYGEMAQHLEAIARETALYGETKPNARRIFPEHC